MSLVIRPAKKSDVFLILSFIKELAAFEKLEHLVNSTPELIEKALFGEGAQTHCVIADYNNQPAGFALYFFNFSTFLGKQGLYLEDLYVRPEFRSHGIGLALLQELARVASHRGCPRMEWSVLKWNTKAIAFYERLGARPMSDWTVYRMETEAIERLAQRNLATSAVSSPAVESI